jgi:Fur family ferric uptake transcriptional regulator
MKTDKISDGFIQFLKSNNHRVTKERLLVLENLYKNDSHIDAENLFIMMKKKGIKISQATIYNTLQLLLEANLINSLSFGESHQHYEPLFSGKQHHHIVCSSCGKVEEFPAKILEKIQRNICTERKYKFLSSAFQIMGVCEKCLRKK